MTERLHFLWASLVVQRVKHMPAMWETWVLSPGQEDPPKKEMATHSSTLAWKISWMEESYRLQSMGSQGVTHGWATSLTPFTKIISKWVKHLNVRLCPSLVTPWTVVRQVPLPMGLSRQEYWHGLPFPNPGDLPNPGIEPRQADSLPS